MDQDNDGQYIYYTGIQEDGFEDTEELGFIKESELASEDLIRVVQDFAKELGLDIKVSA